MSAAHGSEGASEEDGETVIAMEGISLGRDNVVGVNVMGIVGSAESTKEVGELVLDGSNDGTPEGTVVGNEGGLFGDFVGAGLVLGVKVDDGAAVGMTLFIPFPLAKGLHLGLQPSPLPFPPLLRLYFDNDMVLITYTMVPPLAFTTGRFLIVIVRL